MHWKCPLCGSDDNEKDSLRCSCGYELDEKNLRALQWVEHEYFPRPAPGLYEPEPAKTTKQKIGRVIYFIPVIILATVVVLMAATEWMPSKSLLASIFSASFLLNTMSSSLTDDIGVRGVGAVKRTVNPRYFWGQFAFQMVVSFVFALIAIVFRN